ncbi:MAG: entericidin A/B family lipoprotein [Betaproteobacteria bacterium]|nr:MAG: entericidin A/B family lipoprotein [Betaproteobacteria bacterium]
MSSTCVGWASADHASLSRPDWPDTVEGVGKDVKATGQTIEKAADRNKTY